MKGTYKYLPPEVVVHHKEYTKHGDIWAFGCTLIEMYGEKSVWPFNMRACYFYDLSNIFYNLYLPDNLDSVPSFMLNEVKASFSLMSLKGLKFLNL